MTPEQLKLIQQLAELGGVTYIKKRVANLVNAISEMDCKVLELILEDDVSYQDTSKTIFIEKLKELFKEFQSEHEQSIGLSPVVRFVPFGSSSRFALNMFQGLYKYLIKGSLHSTVRSSAKNSTSPKKGQVPFSLPSPHLHTLSSYFRRG